MLVPRSQRATRPLAIIGVVLLSLALIDAAAARHAHAAPSPITPGDATAVYVVNTPIPPTVFASTGVGAITFAAAELPVGLNLDGGTGELAGTPTVASGPTPYLITATDADDSLSVSTTFTITVLPASLTPSAQSITAVVGVPFSSATMAGGGFGGAIAYSVEPTPPVDWAFDQDTGVLSGTLTQPLGETVYTITGTAGTTTATGTVSIRGPPAALTPASQSLEGVVNTPVSSVALVPTGFAAAVTHTLIPDSLPAGLTFDPTLGTIAGTPTAAWPQTSYTISAADGTSTASSSLTLSVAATPLTPALQTVTATAGTAIQPTVAYLATGLTAPVAYSVSPTLPTGLVLSSASGIISGTPRVSAPATDHTVTATDANGVTTTGTVGITVAKGLLASPIITLVGPGTESGSLRVVFTASANAPVGQTYAAEIYELETGALIRTVRPLTSTTAITGLMPGARYEVVVIAEGSVHYNESRSPARSGLAAATSGRLSAPVIISAVGGATPGSIQVTFTGSLNAAPGQTYTARVYESDQVTVVREVARATSPVSVTGLTPGTTYYVTVAADASVGQVEVVSRGRTVVAASTRTAVSAAAAATVALPAAASAAAPTRLGGGWLLVAKGDAAKVTRVIVKARPSVRAAGAPAVKVPRQRPVSLRVKGLPRNVLTVVEVSIRGAWTSMGQVRTTRTGRLAVPVFQASINGRYPLRMTPSSAMPRYLVVAVRTGGGSR
jgi:large repetitive protein